MGFTIVNADIAALKVDAIVNTTDQHYSGGGGVDRHIHELIGRDLSDATDMLPKLHLGEAKATSGFNLPCTYIIHTSGPHWRGGGDLEIALLGSCYRNSVALARTLSCKTLAFPLICSKGKQFPKELALTVAIDAIQECLSEADDIEIVLTVFGDWTRNLPGNVFADIGKTIEESYEPKVESVEEIRAEYELYPLIDMSRKISDGMAPLPMAFKIEMGKLIEDLLDKPTQSNLDRIPIDESFAQMLARLIKEKNLKHATVQDEIEMSNVGFWKLLNGKSHPFKMTVFGIAIALRLSIEEAKEMLMKAGYAVNPSSLQDVIVAGLIQNGVYDRYTIDNLLYSLDLQLLPGASID